MKNIIFALLFAWLIFISKDLQAQGVLFSEYRLVLQRNSIVSLQVCNPTEQTRTFNISVINKRMDNEGVFHAINDSVIPEFSLKQYLRVYPRSVRLAPNECQEIQVQLKTPSSLPVGEYRSYIHFLPLEPIGETQNKISSDGVSFGIKFRVGAAIPIIYRNHTSLGAVTLDSVRLTPMSDSLSMLHLVLHREGNQSVYSRVLVQGVSNGQPIDLTELQATAVYTEMSRKPITTPISVDALDRDANGRIRLIISLIDAEQKSSAQPVVLYRTEVDVGLENVL